MDWRQRFDSEIAAAERSRLLGNEGKARVCARRAAGIVAAEFYARRGSGPRSSSAIDALRRLQVDLLLPPDMLPHLENLVQPVDTAFKLPDGVDLIAEARHLRARLLPD